MNEEAETQATPDEQRSTLSNYEPALQPNHIQFH